MLLVAATTRAAESEVPRSLTVSSAEERIFKVLIAANSQRCVARAGAAIPQLPPSEFPKLQMIFAAFSRVCICQLGNLELGP